MKTIKSLIRIIRKSKIFTRKIKIESFRKNCIILGNGPSLDHDLKNIEKNIAKFDLWCVNQFAISNKYEIFKPKYYIIADSGYWIENTTTQNINERKKLFKKLIEKTNWNMQIFVPHEGLDYIKKIFKYNTFIKVFGYNYVPVEGNRKIIYKIFALGLGMPLAMNVLLVAIFIALQGKYKNIFIVGADHSWHETIELNERNEVCQRDRHFYDASPNLVPFYKSDNKDEIFSMGEIFTVLGKIFLSYSDLALYAEFRNVKIFNASNKTYIDKFERISSADLENYII